MRTSRVLENIKQGRPSLGVTLHLQDPTICELVSLMGFDAVWLDLEHHNHSVETAASLMRAARINHTDVIARPGKGEFMRMSRMLEVGANGIMYPRCDSAAEAREVVKWAKYAPMGARGFDGSGADANFLLTPMKEYIRHSNANTFVIIQVEEPQALSQADEILAIPGVDMLMLGPADYSVITGIPGEFGHASLKEAVEKVAQAAKRVGKHWATTSGSLEQAKQFIGMGASLVFHGCDLVFVKQGLDALRTSAASQLGVKFKTEYSTGKSYLETL